MNHVLSNNLLNLYGIVYNTIGISEIKTIVEAGANNCEDSIGLTEMFTEAHVYSFECNPNTIQRCRDAVKDNPRITLVEKAVSDTVGTLKFYPMNKEKTITTHEDGNQGASSLLKASGLYPIETYVQDEVEVESTTLYEYPQIDMLWLDAQGSELMILKGLKEKIKDVKIIQCEVGFKEQYLGQPLFHDIKEYLETNGFQFHSFFDQWDWFGDAIFINNKYV